MAGKTIVYAAGGTGVLLAYSALKGKNLQSVFRTVATGKNPASATGNPVMSTGISGTSGATGIPVSGSTSGGDSSGLVAIAKRGIGVMYKWGGGNAQGWDCSGFCNDCNAEDGIPLPDGAVRMGDFESCTYSNGPHGPVTTDYYFSSNYTTVPYGSEQPGDLAVWLTHMGIVSGTNLMINAYQTGKPTAETSIKGMGIGLGPLRIRRLVPSNSGRSGLNNRG
jgi:cell wall-associated NlpC family hydrolase